MAQNITLNGSERIVTKEGTPIVHGLMAKFNALVKRVEELETNAVPKDTGTTDWTAWTGTADRATHATYTAATISNPPTQAQVQAIANAVQNNSRGMKGLTDDLLANGAIK